jgi:exopolyphosphatase/guanosine-5'-triphosphate,3'-diphosphate pyrophosphatase
VVRAVIDVGSNSVLLLVAQLRSGVWHPIAETSEVTALGEGAKESGLLAEPGMAATLAAICRAFEIARFHGAEARAFGTMALRVAKNAGVFLERAQQQGTPVSVISGEEEAELGLACVLGDPAFATSKIVTVIDVGGHSTEIACAEGRTVRFRKSFPIGTLGLRSGVLSEPSPKPDAVLRAAAQIDETLGLRFMPNSTGAVVALGATGTNLIAIRERLPKWDPQRVHGAYLDFEEVSRFVGSACRLTDEERGALPGIEPGRERTIHIGALILERCLQAVHALGCCVSVRGWRHAMLERL